MINLFALIYGIYKHESLSTPLTQNWNLLHIMPLKIKFMLHLMPV